MLRGLVLDLTATVDRIELDSGHRMEGWKLTVAMNTDAVDNVLRVETRADVDPDRPERGKLEFAMEGDLSQAQPPFETRYDLDIPYGVLTLLPIDRYIAEKVPFPLFQKIRPKDPLAMDIATTGKTRWRGIDARAVKRSLVSEEKTLVTLGAGAFDLGFPLLELADLGALAGQVAEQLAALQGGLDALRGDQSQLTGQAAEIQKAIADLTGSIDQARNAAGPLRDLIDKLKPLAGFDPSARKKIEEYEAQIAGYDREAAGLLDAKNAKQGELGRIQAELDKVNGEIEKVNRQIEEKKGSMGAGLDLDNPFAFDFAGVTIEIEFSNDNPFGGGGLDVLAGHPTSRVVMIRIRFSPESGTFPEIRGWSDLDGRYEFRFVPGQAQVAALDQQAPGLGGLIGEAGVGWSHEGFVPNPFKGDDDR